MPVLRLQLPFLARGRARGSLYYTGEVHQGGTDPILKELRIESATILPRGDGPYLKKSCSASIKGENQGISHSQTTWSVHVCVPQAQVLCWQAQPSDLFKINLNDYDWIFVFKYSKLFFIHAGTLVAGTRTCLPGTYFFRKKEATFVKNFTRIQIDFLYSVSKSDTY